MRKRAGIMFVVAGLAASVLSRAAAAQQASGEPRQQGTRPLRLSLRDALKIAATASDEMAVARAGTQRARGQELQAQSEFYPQVVGSASYERTLASEFDDVFEAPAGGQDGQAQAFENLPFGRANTYRYGLSVSQNLFAGGRTLAQSELAAAGRSQAQLAVQTTRAQVALDTARAYYDAALSDRVLQIAEATLAQAEDTLRQNELALQAGRLSEFEVLRARVTVDAQRPLIVQRRMQRDLAYLRLKQRLGLPQEQALVLSTQLDSGDASASSEAQPNARLRTAERQALETVRMREASVSAARAGYYPSLTVSTTWGRVAYPEDLVPSSSEFRTNWTAGVYLQVPLFEGLRTRGQVMAAQADLAEARTNLTQTRKAISYESQQAAQELNAARAVWQSTSGTVEQAKRAYEIAALRYKEGVSTQIELNDARLQLQQAELTRAEAARDVQVARLRLSLLGDLPLSTAGGGFSPAPLVTPSAGAPGATTPSGTPSTTSATPGGSSSPAGAR